MDQDIAATYAERKAREDTLKDAIVEMWLTCERHHGIGDFAEMLSISLTRAALALGFTDGMESENEAHDAARDGMVRQRPGSWEADHVRALIIPPYLVESTPASRPSRRTSSGTRP